MKNVLFCCEKWCAANPNFGFTNNFHNLFNTFSQSRDDYVIHTLHLDECSLVYKRNIDECLEEYAGKYNIDLIVFCLLGESNLNPSIESLNRLKSSGRKMCFMWPDTSDWAIGMMGVLDGIPDLNISWDNPSSNKHDSLNLKNHRHLWVPQDSNLFRGDYQDIDVSFIGSTSYPDRRFYLEHATKQVDIKIFGGQRNGKLTPDGYAQLVRKSKININFSVSPCQTYYQCKGRVFEVLSSSSMLLELANPSTRKLFTPDVDYVEFDTVQSLVDKIKYYSKNDSERVRIAEQGNKSYQEYNSKSFWDKIIYEIYR